MKLEAVVRRWRRVQTLSLVIRALGVSLGVGALASVTLPPGPIGWSVAMVLTLAAGLASLWLPHPPMANRRLLASHLDRALPELEDSTDLTNRDQAGLTGLERLQQQRVERALNEIPAEGLWPRAQVVQSLRGLVGGVVVALLVWVGQTQWAKTERAGYDPVVGETVTSPRADDLLEQITVAIHPPAYTGLEVVRQQALDLEAPEGSTILWHLPLADIEIYLAVTGQDPMLFVADDEGSSAEWMADESEVYRIVIGRGESATSSGYSRLTVIPDSPPVLSLALPGDRVTTVSDSTPSVELVAEIEDDHGLRRADLVMTLAQGSGESVEFRQVRRALQPAPRGRQATVETRLELPELGLARGSELYLYVEAQDNREPEPNIARTGTYIVRHPGEQLRSADLGEGLPIVLPPEYFRSQRQIILDTEKLIAEQEDLSAQESRRRSEGLGFDQRALRMRYGTLLGEEFDSGRPIGAGEGEVEVHDDHDHEESDAGPEGPGSAEDSSLPGVPADFAHFHDSAEIATYFTSEIRSQLKQVLAEMWDAEGRLRVHQPREALPYEYRALELLKDLQQRSRVYVQKVAFETPPLEADKLRLTGELEEIRTYTQRLEPAAAGSLEGEIRRLLEALFRQDRAAEILDATVESQIRSALAGQLQTHPDSIVALESFDRWVLGEALDPDQRDRLVAILWRQLPEPDLRPDRRGANADPLSELFRLALSGEEQP